MTGLFCEKCAHVTATERVVYRAEAILQNMWTEKDCFFGGYTKIRNSNTTGIQTREIGHRSNLGIWIDILPIDNSTMEEALFRKKGKKIKHAYSLLNAKVYGKDKISFHGLAAWKWFGYRFLAKCCSHASLCDRLDKAMRLYTEEETEEIAVFSGCEKHRVLRKSDFEGTVFLEFAGRSLPAPSGYENYLFMIMGKDYLKYPPEIERKPRHGGIFDPEKPYTEYLRKLTGMFEGVKGKQIILFGAGMMLDDYMQNWGSRYRPDFLVDNDESKWGRKRYGIEIKAPHAILDIPLEKRRLIICSFYFKEIEKQLEEMGVSDYQVYIQHAEWIVRAEK